MITINRCRIIPMDGPVIEEGAIQIEGTTLRAILAKPVPANGPGIIAAAGLTAIPGMGQMHGHFSGYMHTMDTAPINAQPHTLKAIQATSRAKTIQRSLRLTPFGTEFCEACFAPEPGPEPERIGQEAPAADGDQLPGDQ